MTSRLVLWSCLAASLLACSDDPSPAAPVTPVTPPAPSTLDQAVDQLGPFRVGHRVVTTSYQPPAGLPARTIKVHLWYPTQDTAGESVKYLVFPDPDAFENASLAPPVEAAGYPVHVHSHGAWGFAGNSAHLMRWYASHGWVAVAPDHAGHTLPEKADRIPVGLYHLRPLDIRASLDALEKLPAEDPLAGRTRTQKVSMSGHSFGASTTWSVLGSKLDVPAFEQECAQGERFVAPCPPADLEALRADLSDPRVVSGVPMAGAPLMWFGGAGFDAATRPVLQMSAVGDPVGADQLWSAVTLSRFSWVEFSGGCHQLFGFGDCTDYTLEQGARVVDIYAFAFGRQQVLGDSQPRTLAILSGEAPLSDRVTVRRKEMTP